MHHVALDRPWPDDGDLDHQVVELLRAQAWQHGHLGARFDLEHTDGIGAADHFVGGRVFARDTGDAQPLAAAQRVDQVEAAAQGAEHAQGEDVDLEQADRVEIVLVPLDHRAFGHARILHRDQGVQWLLGDDEAAGVLREVARKTDQLAGQGQHPAQDRTLRIEAGLFQAFGAGGLVAPAAAAVGQDVDLLGRQTQGLGYVAHRAGAVVGADHRGQRRALASVACENVLDDLLAALVFEIHVDVRWFVALAGKEALEQQVGPVRVQLSDAEGEAHCRIGRRAAALAKDFPAPGEGDDVLHGEEIAFIAQFGDQLEFSLDLLADLGARAVRPAPGDALFGEMAEP
ncbi:Uncharacterised protein [Klebsiella pneumoniae]|nr:hypothetical protein PAERUG_P1_London_28_IMP_1_04_05_00344 [Pseudomonas aeruginosa]CRR99450.1 hypothetical protein PAERUG_P48_London_17_VIM_2_01_13_03473 [Pseudomonas aeruginosa]SVJ73028.1 Uncharacterised protein [Klebsiella pneumoniae]